LADLLLVNKKPGEQRFAGFCASLLWIDGNFERCSNFLHASRGYFQCVGHFYSAMEADNRPHFASPGFWLDDAGVIESLV
jgi:hypothetical protein